MNFLQNEAFFICSSMNFQKMPISRGGHEGGEGGTSPLLRLRRGKRRRMFGPKNMRKKNGYQMFFLRISKAFEISF